MARRGFESEFLDEAEGEERSQFAGQVVRWALAFAALFAVVFFCFWWSGSAIRFGAARVAEKPVPTWRVFGVVRNAATGEPIPWAVLEDDPAGRPPFFRSDADQTGVYSLLTLAEPHSILVRATGFQSLRVAVGREWFVWWPKGEERHDIALAPETGAQY